MADTAPDLRGLQDTAPTRTNQGAALQHVRRTDAATEAANATLFSVLDETARRDGDPAVRAAALSHIENMRGQGKVVFPEDTGEAAAAAPRAQVAAVAPTVATPAGAVEVAQETVYGLLSDTGIVTRTPAGGAAAEEETQAPPEAAAIPLTFSAPADLADELDLDDDEDEDEPLPAAQYREPVDLDGEDVEYEDPRVVEALRRAKKAEKKAAHYESLRLTESKKTWVAEAKEHLGPAVTKAQLDGIQASSRKDFWRQARQIHAANVELLAPLVDGVVAKAKQDAEAVKAQAREDAARAWGRPTVGAPGAASAPALAAQQASEEEIARLRRRGNFGDYLKAKLKAPGGV